MIEVVDMTQVLVDADTWHGVDADSENRKLTLCGESLESGVRGHWDMDRVRCLRCRAIMLFQFLKKRGVRQ